MEHPSFNRRVVSPICLVLGVMILSSAAYDHSRHIENHALHLIISHAAAVFMFLSIWLGALFANNHPFVGALLPMNLLYRGYCETVASVDEQVGRMIQKLKDLNILDNTLIVYAGDNGHFWGEHGLYDKRLAYEESIRIPSIIRYPGLIKDPGRRAHQMIVNSSFRDKIYKTP